MRSGRMPISIAALRSSATASSFEPIVVWVRNRCIAMVSTAAVMPATSCAVGTRMPAIFSVPPSEVCGSDTTLAEKIQNAV